MRGVLGPRDVQDAIDALDDLIAGKVEGFEDVMLEAAVGEDVSEMTLEERRDCVAACFTSPSTSPGCIASRTTPICCGWCVGS